MENVLPKCKCGADVHTEDVKVPFYDVTGTLRCVHEYNVEMTECYSCMYEPPAELWESSLPMFGDERDELPF